jgi:hypothetical protein
MTWRLSAALAPSRNSSRWSGLRVGDQVPIETAQKRIERQVAASAVWVELDGDFAGRSRRSRRCLRG